MGDTRAGAGAPGEDALAALVTAVTGEPDPDARRELIAQGMVSFGMSLVDALLELDESVGEDEESGFGDEAVALLLSWLDGARLSWRADEAERRLAAATDALEAFRGEVRDIEGLYAVSMLELPEDHPARDAAAALGLLRRCLERGREDGDIDEQLRALARIVLYRLEPSERLDELCAEGLALAAEGRDAAAVNAEAADALLTAASDYYVERAIEARDAVGILRHRSRDEGAYRHWMQKADAVGELIAASRGQGETLVAAYERAVDHDRNGRYAEAAELYSQVWRGSPLENPGVTHAAKREAELRLRLGEPERAVAAAGPLLSLLTERYVTAVSDDDIADAGNELADAAGALAFAQARLGRFGEAVQAIDQAKSVRLRHTAALRRRPEGQRALVLERALESVRRGLDVDPGLAGENVDLGAITLEGQLLEAYRRARPLLARETVESPTVAEIAAALEPQEAAVVLGVDTWGTLAALVRCGEPGPEPTASLLSEELNLRWWIELIAGEEGVGWLSALSFSGEEELDRPTLLEQLLASVDEQFGRQLRKLVPCGVRRLAIMAHGLLHLVPFWGLESLCDLDLLVAPSAAALVAARARELTPVAGRALIVSNPTNDLRASPAEVAAVRGPLSGLGLEVELLEQEAATQARVTEALAGATVVHLIAHGRSELGDERRSALILAPGDGQRQLRAVLQREELWEEGQLDWRWEEFADEGFADLEGVGRLYQRLHPNGLKERWIVRAESDPWALVAEHRLIAAGQLWQAGEILLEDRLDGCALAYLAACESGMRAAGAVDEYGGLPAAFAVAGADNVVATMWPVAEPLATLYAHLFYTELAARVGEGNVALASVVAAATRRLRSLSREHVCSLCDELALACEDPWAAMALEGFAYSLEGQAERPFARPHDWAAFYAAGSGRLILHHEDKERR